MLEQILNDDLQWRVLAALKRHGVAHAAIFGSFARGSARENSDIDLLVEFSRDTGLLDMAALRLDLEDVLGRPVDVVTDRGLNPRMRDQVMRERRVIL